MADNTSHTDEDGADDRAPPPGIEVIGELPAGVAWWDAEELGIPFFPNKRDQILSLFGVGVLIVASLILLGLPFYLAWPDVLLGWLDERWLAVIAGAALLWVASSQLVSLLFQARTRYFVRLGADLRSTAHVGEWMGDSPRPAMCVRAAGCYAVRASYSDDFDWIEFDPDERVPYALTFIEVYDSSSSSPEPICSLPRTESQLLVCSVDQILHPLLTYRLAKAKGENPPPPELS